MTPTPSPASLLSALEEHIRGQGVMITATEAAIRSLEQFLAAARDELAGVQVLRAELLVRMLPSRES